MEKFHFEISARSERSIWWCRWNRDPHYHTIVSVSVIGDHRSDCREKEFCPRGEDDIMEWIGTVFRLYYLTEDVDWAETTASWGKGCWELGGEDGQPATIPILKRYKEKGRLEEASYLGAS